MCREEAGKPFLYYVDNLKLYTEHCGLERICRESNVAAALAVIPVINIQPRAK